MKRLLLFLIISCAICPTIVAQTPVWNLVRKGNHYFEMKRYTKAEDCYLKAKQLAEADNRIVYNLANVYIAKKDYKAARSLLETLVKNEDNVALKAKAYYNLGYIAHSEASSSTELNKQKKIETAIAYYKDALRCNHKDEAARFNLTLCLQQQKAQRQQLQTELAPPQSPNNQPQKPIQMDAPVQQLLNLARQSEQQTKSKVNQVPKRRRNLENNW